MRATWLGLGDPGGEDPTALQRHATAIARRFRHGASLRRRPRGEGPMGARDRGSRRGERRHQVLVTNLLRAIARAVTSIPRREAKYYASVIHKGETVRNAMTSEKAISKTLADGHAAAHDVQILDHARFALGCGQKPQANSTGNPNNTRRVQVEPHSWSPVWVLHFVHDAADC